MRSIMFDNGDIVIKSKRMQMVDDVQQKIQKTKGSLLVVKGELFYNGDIGLDYTQVLDITEKNISDDHKKIAITEAIMKDNNAEKIDNITIETEQSSRKQHISLQLKYKDETEQTTIGGVPIG